MNTYIIDSITYTFGIIDATLDIEINRDIFTKYKIIITDDNCIFKNHSIIKDIDILNRVLNDGFKGHFDTIISFSCDDLNNYIININVTSRYICDNIKLTIPPISNPINNNDIIKHIDDLRNNLTSKHDNDIKLLKDENDKRIASIQQCITDMRSTLVIMEMMFQDYKLSHPIFYGHKGNKYHIIDVNCTQLKIIYENSKYYLDDYYEIINLNWNDISLLENLTHATFINCGGNLNFLRCFNSLTELMLVDIPDLGTISHLLSFPKLNKITIIGQHKITDIKDLHKCPGLRTLILPLGPHIFFPPAKKMQVIYK